MNLESARTAARCATLARSLLLGCAALAACVSAPASVAPEGGSSEESQTVKIADARQAELIARLELDKTRLETEADQAEAQAKAELAGLALAKTRHALEAFETERSLRMDQAEVNLDVALGRATDAELELAELEAMYAEEEFAEKTKELVLTRGRRGLEIARRKLAIQRRQFAQLKDDELPREEVQLRTALSAKEGELSDAQRALEVGQLDSLIKIAKAEAALAKAERKLSKATDDES